MKKEKGVILSNMEGLEINMQNCREWFIVVLALIGLILFLITMFMNYNLKLSAKQAELKKEIQQVERVNGKEKRDITELQEQVRELKEKLNHGKK